MTKPGKDPARVRAFLRQQMSRVTTKYGIGGKLKAGKQAPRVMPLRHTDKKGDV